jgi:RNA polymerase sigma-70 factor (ECF subfamily)
MDALAHDRNLPAPVRRRAALFLAWRNPAAPCPRPSFPCSSGAMTPPDDKSPLILAVAQTRDRESFRLLFLHFAPRVKSYLLHLGMAGQLADELAQETLLMVWRKADRFDPARAGAATWIFTIARNLRIDQLRRGKLPGDYYQEEEFSPSAGEDYLAAERDGQVSQALKALPADQAEVIRLSFFEEKPHPVIAAELGIPLGTVKSRLRLAMSRLRMALEDVK